MDKKVGSEARLIVRDPRISLSGDLHLIVRPEVSGERTLRRDDHLIGRAHRECSDLL